jgi:hypothetical protein
MTLIYNDDYRDIEIYPSEIKVGDLYNSNRIILFQPNWTDDSVRVEFFGNEKPRYFYKSSRIIISRKIDY